MVAILRPMGSPEAFEGTVHGTHGKPLQIAGKTRHIDLQWGEARGRSCFIVIVGLELPPCLIGIDIMRPLRVRIDVTNGTATPAQPDPQTVHLNAAQQQRKKILPPNAAPPAAPKLLPSRYQPRHRKSLRLPLASRYPLRHEKSHRQPLPPTPLAALCCSRQQRYP